MGDLGVTYDDHLRLIGKRIVDFLLVLIELFRCVTAEALRTIQNEVQKLKSSKSAISVQRGLVDQKFQIEGVDLHQPICFSEN